MASNVFSAFGLDVDPGILFIILFVLVIMVFIFLIVLLGKYNSLKKSYDKFMMGKKAKSLEDEIASIFEDISLLKISADKSKRDIKKIIENLRDTYQRVGIVKYDAFKEMGGKLSFSIALLNDNQTGFLLNSVHSSDGCYVYTKEIIEGKCSISLGEEEKKALMLALQEDTINFD